MNVFQLVLKQMRQRALGTWLTLLSVTLGVALAVAVLLVRRGGESLFGQTDYGYDLIVGKGSPLQLVLNTVYQIDRSPGNISYSIYENLARPGHPQARLAVPISVGDRYKGLRVLGTLPTLFQSTSELQQPIGALLSELNALAEQTRAAADAGAVKSLATRLRELRARTDSVRKDLAFINTATSTPLGKAMGQMDVAVVMLESGDKAAAADAQKAAANDLAAAQAEADRLKAGPLAYRPSKTYRIAEGRVFGTRRFEAVVGSDVPRLSGVKLGDKIKVAHDAGDAGGGEEHHEQWEVVGFLQPTHTANDRVVFIPLVTTLSIGEHEKAMEIQTGIREGQRVPSGGRAAPKPAPKPVSTGPTTGHGGHDEDEPYIENSDGTIDTKLPKDQWLISAILVQARGGDYSATVADQLKYAIDAGKEAVGVRPAPVMSEFFHDILQGGAIVLLLVSLLVSIVAAIGILVSIYNSVSARKREIAILRALGATRRKVLLLICVEAGLIGLAGGVVGLLLGHLVGAVGSTYMDRVMGQGFNWLHVGWEEGVYLLGVLVIAVLAGLVPAMKAYRTPVATNLVAV